MPSKKVSTMKTTKNFSIKAASLRSKLSAHVIRVWEKRYQAVVPDRTDTQRRVVFAGGERLADVRLGSAGQNRHPSGRLVDHNRHDPSSHFHLNRPRI